MMEMPRSGWNPRVGTKVCHRDVMLGLGSENNVGVEADKGYTPLLESSLIR